MAALRNPSPTLYGFSRIVSRTDWGGGENFASLAALSSVVGTFWRLRVLRDRIPESVMGERGPLPVTYARRRNRRRRSQYATTGHHVTIERPAMPRALRGEARAEWNRVVPELEDMGIIAAIDRALLIRYCTAWAEWIELDALLQQSGKLIRGQKGNLVRNPVWLLRRDAEETVTELARQLGLSPVARLRAGVVHDRPKDPDEKTRGMLMMEEYKRRLGEPDPREILKSTS